MKSLFKTQIEVIIIIALLLLLSNLGMAVKLNESENNVSLTLQDPEYTESRPVPIDFYLQRSNGLSPELPKESVSDSYATCQNGFVAAWWSPRGMFGHTDWKDVGTWTTIEVNKALLAQGSVKFRLWMAYVGSGTRTGTLGLYWKRNEENIAEIHEYTVRFEEGMPPTMIEAEAPLINQTPFQVGDKFSVYIRCKNNFDGAQLIYGSAEHASAIIMQCNPLDLIEVHACKNEISAVYDDVFQVRPNVMNFVAKVDNVVIDSIPSIDFVTMQDRQYRSANWKSNLKPGEHNIEVTISYFSSNNKSVVTLSKQIKIKGVEEPTFLGIPLWIFHLIVGLIVIAIIAGVAKKAYNYHEEQKWMKSQGYK